MNEKQPAQQKSHLRSLTAGFLRFCVRFEGFMTTPEQPPVSFGLGVHGLP